MVCERVVTAGVGRGTARESPVFMSGRYRVRWERSRCSHLAPINSDSGIPVATARVIKAGS